ncbi:Dihydroorotate dehydrogenase B (NAD(+)), electron transfer subunit [Anatilimnocola aggregata]|uniref:Dihydroorotate dehydrogenase B (NAD(+)), electron transfer subunit n=1 Tax=Anatilimnocola aggregata TaxID=2528021 RepID=A0A517YAX1_9BACT|nr:dihydroorotate dehydrogenase electron transfer subunit [Anatilimnocola aggregata]QDU27383.1 Dihydroorotate dehydrogenase B (NAD(+)), electron transfer subunit [Anatilimnocola aggregata]
MSVAHAPYLADSAVQRSVEIVENIELARDTWRVRFRFPELAAKITPGQFVMLKLAGFNDPLLGRPLAMYDVQGNAQGEATDVDVVYLVKGKLTSRLCNLQPGQRLDVWGPLGNGFQPQPTEHLIMVAGGIGQTPFLALAKEYLGLARFGLPQRSAPPARRVTFCYGARNQSYFAGVEDFEALGVDVRLATDDGSRGKKGLVTDLLREVLAEDRGQPRIVCCGPEPMMEAVSLLAAQQRVPCQISLETPMACGIGICFTCVAKVRDEDGEWDYRRTCVEGPVFDSSCIVW